MTAHGDALDQARQLVMIGAWHTEAFARTKRMPSLEKLLRPRAAAKPDALSLAAKARGFLMAYRPEEPDA